MSPEVVLSDAFIFECLKHEASEMEPIVVVSDDGDFDTPSKDAINISVLKSIPELFCKAGPEGRCSRN